MHKLLITLSILLLSTSINAQREFWGTTTFGGLYGDGTLYKTDANGDNLEIVHHFKENLDGRDISALTLASNNKLYGMAASGGTISGGNVYAGGTFFGYDLATGKFTVLQNFGIANSALPGVVMPLGGGQVSLTEVSPGILYGIMMQGAYVFAYNISTGVFTQPFVLPLYSGGATNSTLQNKLNRGFQKGADGNFYVSTATNSSCPIPNPNMGSIMRMNAAGTAITVRFRASCLAENGYVFKGPMVETNGKLFGITDYGGDYNEGVIFEYNIAANTYLKRYDFNGGNSYYPQALTLAGNGKLYGVAHGGGIPEPNPGLPAGGGVLYEFDPTNGDFEVKHNFTITGQSIYDLGVFPTDIITGFNGKLYGATQYGVFEYDTQTETMRTAGRFNGLGFGPSILEVCRKPYYTLQAQSTISVCEGEAFELDLQSPNATSVEWKHNNVADATQTTAKLQLSAFGAADAGTWSCTLTNACGTTDTQTITLIAGNTEIPVVEANGPTEVCAGETVTLTAPEGYEQYNWLSGETTRILEVTESGSYSLTVSNGCVSEPSEPIEIVMNPLPPLPVITQSYDHGIVLLASGSISGQYYWTFNNEPVMVQTDRILNAQEGVYQVYSVSNEDCRSAEGTVVNVVITGTEPFYDSKLQVYPNPANDQLNINWNVTDGEVVGYDVTGRKMFTFESNQSIASSIDIRTWPEGIYLLLFRKERMLQIKRIQIVR